MKTPMKKRILIAAAALAIVALIAGTAAYYGITGSRHFDGGEAMRIDPAEEKHHFAELTDRALAQFSSLYWLNGIVNPFKHKHDVSVAEFFTDIRKDGPVYSINWLLMTVQFQQNGYLYTQHLEIRKDHVSSNIISQSLDTVQVFNDGPTLDTFMDKLDRLDYSYLSNQLPECDGHIIDMLMPSDMLYRSADSVSRYLVNANGSYMKSAKDADTPLGAKVPVISMLAATISGNEYGGSESVDVYLNN